MFSPVSELWKGYWKEKERKRILLRWFPAAGISLFRYAENAKVFGTFRGLDRIRGAERKEEDLL